uniref:Uncharacterized protein n=1 Tax=Panagrolaimus sp. PS1159 TaxID=55785 RepID=A0AC35FR20_9BILA
MQSTQLKLDIRQNPAFKNLPFVPKTIYMPPKQEKGTKPLTIFELREQALSTPMILVSDRKWNTGRLYTDKGKPKYKFDEIPTGGGRDLCSCCARCGSQGETTQISQMMVMDFSMIYDSINNSFENIFSYESLLEKSKVKCTCLHSCIEIPKKLPFILPTLRPGKWKTQIVTKLCLKCIGWFKEEADKVATEYLETKMVSMEVDDNNGDIVAEDIERERKRQVDDRENEANNKKSKNQLQSETTMPQDNNEDAPMNQEINASFYQDPQICHNFEQPYYTYENSGATNDVFFNDLIVPHDNYYYNSQYDNTYEPAFAHNFCAVHSDTEFNSNFHMLLYQSEQQPQNYGQFLIYESQEQQQQPSSSTSQWYNNGGASYIDIFNFRANAT